MKTTSPTQLPLSIAALAASALLALPMQAAAQVTLFDVDFESPHMVDSTVLVGGGNSDRPSRINFGAPTVLAETIADGNSLEFRAGDGYQQIEFFLTGEAGYVTLSYDVQTDNFAGLGFVNNTFTMTFDTPTVRTYSMGGGQFPEGPSFEDGTTYRVEHQVDLLNNEWITLIDGVVSRTTEINAEAIQDIRFNFNLSDADDDSSIRVLLDNVVITEAPEGPNGGGGEPDYWSASGWCFLSGNYLYSSDEEEWRYLGATQEFWNVNFGTGGWSELSSIGGWVYFNGPYFYSANTSEWHFISQTTTWYINLIDPDEWVIFGEPPA